MLRLNFFYLSLLAHSHAISASPFPAEGAFDKFSLTELNSGHKVLRFHSSAARFLNDNLRYGQEVFLNTPIPQNDEVISLQTACHTDAPWEVLPQYHCQIYLDTNYIPLNLPSHPFQVSTFGVPDPTRSYLSNISFTGHSQIAKTYRGEIKGYIAKKMFYEFLHQYPYQNIPMNGELLPQPWDVKLVSNGVMQCLGYKYEAENPNDPSILSVNDFVSCRFLWNALQGTIVNSSKENLFFNDAQNPDAFQLLGDGSSGYSIWNEPEL